jgi:hypothetical protein
MRKQSLVWLCALLLIEMVSIDFVPAEDIFTMPEGVETRWFSFENPTGAKGAGGLENNGAKGHSFDKLTAGESKVLMDYAGGGIVRRMWFTVDDKSPENLRSLRLRMYWDGANKPAVDVPFGDFFGAILGRMTTFESHYFASPEGRSFLCTIPMPFRSSARITVTNESKKVVPLFFYDIDITTHPTIADDALYFHAFWSRMRWTEVGKDFVILPRITGKGRFLGTNIGVITHPDNIGWWGEGEVKMYIDGDTAHPTLIGTGAEDYIGTGWGQGEFNQQYQGSLISDRKSGHYTFYRYHGPDPVYFYHDMKVTIQSLGGAGKREVLKMLEDGVDIKPVSINSEKVTFIPLLAGDKPIALDDEGLPDGWTNFYRRDDYSAVAYFYLNAPENMLPELVPIEERCVGLTVKR